MNKGTHRITGVSFEELDDENQLEKNRGTFDARR
jgi:hypothetical protein